MRYLFAFIALFIFCINAFAEEAPVMEKPTFKMGDWWEFKNKHSTVKCKHWEIVELSGNSLVEACDDYKMYFKVGDNYQALKVTKNDKAILSYSPSFPGLDFPLKVGKKWSGKYSGYRADTGGKWDSTVDFQVVAFEDVTVAAGTFKAYRIEYVDKWVSGSFRGSNKSVGWIAPEVGYYVKLKHEDSIWNHEITGFSRQ